MIYIVKLGDYVKVGITSNIKNRIKNIESWYRRRAEKYFFARIPDILPDNPEKKIFNWCETGSQEERRYEKILYNRLKPYLESGEEFFQCSYEHALKVVLDTINDKHLQLPYNQHYFDDDYVSANTFIYNSPRQEYMSQGWPQF